MATAYSRVHGSTITTVAKNYGACAPIHLPAILLFWIELLLYVQFQLRNARALVKTFSVVKHRVHVSRAHDQESFTEIAQ